MEKRISELEQENKRLHDTVEYLTRKLFSRSTEKTSSLALGQVSLFDEAEIQADPQAPEPDLKDALSYQRKKFKGQRKELLKDLPRTKRLCTLVAEDRFCEACNTALVPVGEEFIRTEIEFIPAQVRVIDYYRETFECRTCRKDSILHKFLLFFYPPGYLRLRGSLNETQKEKQYHYGIASLFAFSYRLGVWFTKSPYSVSFRGPVLCE